MIGFFRAKVSPEVALRALAISLVTFHHSQKLGLPVAGGMSFLLLLSGYGFAKFAMNGRSAADVRKSLLSLAAAVAVPTLLVVLASSLIRQEFEWSEFLLVSNWIQAESVAYMYLWYPDVLVQTLLGLWVVFSIPKIANLILGNPFWSALAIFGAALLVRQFLPDPSRGQHLPHLFLWNFVLGWLVYFTLTTPVIQGYFNKRLFALACTVGGGIVGWSLQESNLYILTVFTAMFLFVRTFPMPGLVAKGVNLVSQATFGVFLLHRAFIALYDHYFAQDTLAKFMFSMVLSIAAWLLVVSLVRAYAVLRRPAEPGPWPAGGVAEAA